MLPGCSREAIFIKLISVKLNYCYFRKKKCSFSGIKNYFSLFFLLSIRYISCWQRYGIQVRQYSGYNGYCRKVD